MKTMILALLIAASPAFAGKLPDAIPKECYETLDMAARIALHRAMKLSERHEWGGAIIAWQGVFCMTTPVTNGRSDRVNFNLILPNGAQRVALYHTHAAMHPASETDRFSATDVQLATEAGVRSYLGIARTGEIRVFDPVTMTARNAGARGGARRPAFNTHAGEVLP